MIQITHYAYLNYIISCWVLIIRLCKLPLFSPSVIAFKNKAVERRCSTQMIVKQCFDELYVFRILFRIPSNVICISSVHYPYAIRTHRMPSVCHPHTSYVNRMASVIQRFKGLIEWPICMHPQLPVKPRYVDVYRNIGIFYWAGALFSHIVLKRTPFAYSHRVPI